MPVPITNLMRNQVAHYHCTTGGSPLWSGMRSAKGNVRKKPEADILGAISGRLAFRAGYLRRLQSGALNMSQPADRNLANQIGQFIDKRLVDSHPERILRKKIAVSHKNAALPHQGYCCTESRAVLYVR